MPTKHLLILIGVIVLTTLASFYSGFSLSKIYKKDNIVANNTNPDDNLKPYFRDEIILISKEEPHYTVIAHVTRSLDQNSKYIHRQKMFFYDGKKWQNKSVSVSSDNSSIEKTALVLNWLVEDDPSLVLKQSVKGDLLIDKTNVKFEVPMITNEMGIRSLENYTIFRSEASGKLIVNGKEYDSNVLYTRIYSYATSIDMIEVSEPVGIDTDWVAFWDNEGNFYNIDETVVDSKIKGKYKSHSIAVFKDKDQKVQKSFTLDIQKKADLGYKISIMDKINSVIDVNFLNSVSKNTPSSPYTWMTGQLKGTVRLENGKTINGFGIYEQIYQ